MSITACFHYNTDSWVDVTSVNFNSEKVHEDKIFGRQEYKIYYNFSQEYSNITNIPKVRIGTLNMRFMFDVIPIHAISWIPTTNQ